MSCSTFRTKKIIAGKSNIKDLRVGTLRFMTKTADVVLEPGQSFAIKQSSPPSDILSVDPTGGPNSGPIIKFDGIIDAKVITLVPELTNPLGPTDETAIWIESTTGHLHRGMQDIEVRSSEVVTVTGTQTLTGKTLTAPVISSVENTGSVVIPSGPETLVARATVDTLSNKTLVSPQITGYTTLGHVDTILSQSGVEGALVWDHVLQRCRVYDGTAWKNLSDQ